MYHTYNINKEISTYRDRQNCCILARGNLYTYRVATRQQQMGEVLSRNVQGYMAVFVERYRYIWSKHERYSYIWPKKEIFGLKMKGICIFCVTMICTGIYGPTLFALKTPLLKFRRCARLVTNYTELCNHVETCMIF